MVRAYLQPAGAGGSLDLESQGVLLRGTMGFRSIFTEPSKPAHPAFQYGMLVVILVLLAADVWWRVSFPPVDRYMNSVVVLILLFNHLAYQFQWPPLGTVAIRILAWGWLVCGLLYVVFCASRVFQPIHMPEGK